MTGTWAWTRSVTRLAVLTGAGISTASGIPDYRGPAGVWTLDPRAAAAFTLDTFRHDRATRVTFWQTYAYHGAFTAQPNAAHMALTRLDQPGRALRILTQNIDGLHQKAGLAPRKVLELHGTMATTTCLDCRTSLPTAQVLDRVRGGETDPHCVVCGGVLKLATILFGERLDPHLLHQAAAIAANSQLLLAIIHDDITTTIPQIVDALLA